MSYSISQLHDDNKSLFNTFNSKLNQELSAESIKKHCWKTTIMAAWFLDLAQQAFLHRRVLQVQRGAPRQLYFHHMVRKRHFCKKKKKSTEGFY